MFGLFRGNNDAKKSDDQVSEDQIDNNETFSEQISDNEDHDDNGSDYIVTSDSLEELSPPQGSTESSYDNQEPSDEYDDGLEELISVDHIVEPEHSDSEEQEADEENVDVDEWFDDNEVEVEAPEPEPVAINEEDQGGWYDVKTLVDYDEKTTDEEIDKISESTSNDNLGESYLPDSPMTPTEKADDRWVNEGGAVHPEEYEDDIPEEDHYIEGGTDATDSLIILDSGEDHIKEELTALIKDNHYYLIDLTEEFTGSRILPENGKFTPLPVSSKGPYEGLLDIPLLVMNNEYEGAYLIINGLDDSLSLLKNDQDITPVMTDTLVSRARDILNYAKNYGMTVVVTPHKSPDLIREISYHL